MHPVAAAGFGESSAASRAAFAEGMNLRILSHPESKHNARLRTVGRAWNEQEEPHVGGLSVGVGGGTGLACNFACFLDRKRKRSLFPFVRFQLPDLIAQGIHAGDDPSPEP